MTPGSDLVRVMKIAIDQIDPNPEQPRRHFDDLETLAESIKANGLIESITVRPAGDRYQIVVGERRWRAAGIAGLTEIDAQVKDLTDDDARVIALVENVQRADLTPTEEAAAFQDLIGRGWTQKEIARTVGKTQSYVSHKIRLLKLPDHIRYYLDAGLLTENHIRQVLRLQKIYPPGLVTRRKIELSPETLADPARMQVVFHLLRPLAYMPGIRIGDPEIEGLRHLTEYVSKHTDDVLEWEIGAAWWCAFASAVGLNVADLAQAITNWQAVYESAIAGATYISGAKDLRAAHLEDLRHSGSIGTALSLGREDPTVTPETWEWFYAIIRRILNDGSTVLPSRVQAGRMPAPLEVQV